MLIILKAQQLRADQFIDPGTREQGKKLFFSMLNESWREAVTWVIHSKARIWEEVEEIQHSHAKPC